MVAVEKKIVLVGPMATGKTTFKRVFFEDANPLELLSQGIEPTRGIEADAFKFLSNTVAVWDLAGQENDAWLDKKSDVFQEATVIACMASVSQDIKETVLFLVKFLKKWQTLEPKPALYILLHKCDLVAESESYNTMLKIEQYMKVNHPEFGDACKRTNIFRTSITSEYFIRTLMIAYEMLGKCIEKRDLQLTNTQLKEIKAKIGLLTTFEPKKWYTLDMLSASVPGFELQEMLADLCAIGYVIVEQEQYYALSERGEYFSLAWSSKGSIPKTAQAMAKIGFFLSLNDKLEKIRL